VGKISRTLDVREKKILENGLAVFSVEKALK
jgi:hypothetical protein